MSERSVESGLSDHIMLDIETLGTGPDAVILSIGACSVATDQFGRPWVTYYDEIDPTQAGRVTDISTVIWWMEQSLKGTTPPMCGIRPIEEILGDFNSWLHDDFIRPIVVWCKGTDFDIKILTHAMKQHNIKPAWKYNNVRDCRTVFELFPVAKEAIPANENPHNALEDAIHQAAQLAYTARTYNFTLA